MWESKVSAWCLFPSVLLLLSTLLSWCLLHLLRVSSSSNVFVQRQQNLLQLPCVWHTVGLFCLVQSCWNQHRAFEYAFIIKHHQVPVPFFPDGFPKVAHMSSFLQPAFGHLWAFVPSFPFSFFFLHLSLVPQCSTSKQVLFLGLQQEN